MFCVVLQTVPIHLSISTSKIIRNVVSFSASNSTIVLRKCYLIQFFVWRIQSQCRVENIPSLPCFYTLQHFINKLKFYIYRIWKCETVAQSIDLINNNNNNKTLVVIRFISGSTWNRNWSTAITYTLYLVVIFNIIASGCASPIDIQFSRKRMGTNHFGTLNVSLNQMLNATVWCCEFQ